MIFQQSALLMHLLYGNIIDLSREQEYGVRISFSNICKIRSLLPVMKHLV